MTSLEIVQNNHAAFVIEVGEVGGVPILAHEGGHYPSLRTADGRLVAPCGDVPFVRAVRWEGKWDVALYLEGPADRNFPFASRADDRSAAVAEAAGAVERVRALFAEYGDLAKRLHAMGVGVERTTRELYERACSETGIAPLADADLRHAGISPHSPFPVPHADPRRAAHAWASRWRAAALQNEAAETEEAGEAARLLAAAAVSRERREALATMPVSRRYEALLVGRAEVGGSFLQADGLHEVAEVLGRRTVTEDDPSVFGPHLLGSEGQPATLVTMAVRSQAGS